ncbi:hypothetical protein E6R60_05795 [Streptomyces sp. A0642]|uniref:hypothetical protein n=1 Tax=Streptomyces sp. A0642 TaxID=2563100 RepID=UPI0010A20C9E|nr:hypothetical protein [Streptomyces sp. A0642]THA78396.1 hypothetical protein E6R60_05795 [Streptomyces sp. A0642]
MSKPIIPTRIIPGGAQLPDRLPEPGELPPWWETPAPPLQPPPLPAPAPTPEPEPRPLQVYVTVQTEPYYEEPEPTRWQRLWAGLHRIGRPWQICGALLLAVLPVPGTGFSAATTWAYAVGQARDEWGAAHGYVLALLPLVWVIARTARHGGTLLRVWGITVALAGLLGALDPFDIVTILTGVHR